MRRISALEDRADRSPVLATRGLLRSERRTLLVLKVDERRAGQ
jgi:hypothetical protein